MTVTVTSFRTNFPAFADASVYSTPSIQFWLDLGVNLINAERWGSTFDYGQQLFVAHNLSLEFSANGNAAAGQQPGQVTGAITSASVDKVSYSRDASSAMDPKNGHWNLSTYGLRYIQLARMMGAGPIQVGIPAASTEFSAAWSGPAY